MPKQRIAIDMDGVMADVTVQFLKYHEAETGIKLTIDEVNGLPDAVAFPSVRKWVYTEGFFGLSR